MSGVSVRRQPTIVALPNGGTAVWIGTLNRTLRDDLRDALSLAGVRRGAIDLDATLAGHDAEREADGLRAEAGMASLAGGMLTLDHECIVLPDGRALHKSLIVCNVRGRECLLFALSVGGVSLELATVGEVEGLLAMLGVSDGEG